MNYNKFLEYIKSHKFEFKKKEFMKKNKSLSHLKSNNRWKCYCCGSEIDVEIRHKTYDNLYNENIETDLIPICIACDDNIKLLRKSNKYVKRSTLIDQLSKYK